MWFLFSREKSVMTTVIIKSDLRNSEGMLVTSHPLSAHQYINCDIFRSIIFYFISFSIEFAETRSHPTSSSRLEVQLVIQNCKKLLKILRLTLMSQCDWQQDNIKTTVILMLPL